MMDNSEIEVVVDRYGDPHNWHVGTYDANCNYSLLKSGFKTEEEAALWVENQGYILVG